MSDNKTNNNSACGVSLAPLQERFPEGLFVNINMDEYYGCGIKDIQITVDKEIFVFTKQEVKELLTKFKSK